IAHPEQILTALFSNRIGILLIEGGAYVHQLFIDQHAWDEAWVIRAEHELNSGIKAPVVKGILKEDVTMSSDQIITIVNDQKSKAIKGVGG
ncbi:MAG: hypothetical protein ABJB16_00705, partial [Saprospiraceae bacterium]